MDSGDDFDSLKNVYIREINKELEKAINLLRQVKTNMSQLGMEGSDIEKMAQVWKCFEKHFAEVSIALSHPPGLHL